MKSFLNLPFVLTFFLFSTLLFAQLDSVYYEGPSVGNVSGGAIQNTDNFSNMPIPLGEPKIIPQTENPFEEPMLYSHTESSLPPYVYIADKNTSGLQRFENRQTVLLQKFPGIPMTSFIPPDPIIAAGPNHIIACVNSQFSIWEKSGNLLKVIPAIDWWAPIWPDEAGGPQVIYDHYSGRWVIS